MRKHFLILALFLAAVLFGPAVWAATTNSSLVVGGIPVTFSSDGTSAAVDELDPGTNSNKRAAVIACTVSGQAVVMLVRFEKATNGLFIDVLASDTVTNLTTQANAMNFSSRSHPSPTVDAIDTAILTAAAAD